MKSTTSRNKKYFVDNGYICGYVEKWNPHVGEHGIRQDLFGFADLLVFHPDRPGCILVQSTSGSNHASRVHKILANEKAKAWVQTPVRQIAVVSDSKVVKRNKDGSKAKRKAWKVRVQFISERDFGKDAF